MADKLNTQPPQTSCFLLSYPKPYILLITINREKSLNAISLTGHFEGASIFSWFDNEPSLRVAVITGAGRKSFCAGQDLIDLGERRSRESEQATVSKIKPLGVPEGGFMGMSKRVGKKPILAAVNGFALGGGFEICLNCDIIVASPTASFGLPEVAVGLYAAAGGLPRLVSTCGMFIASEIALAGRRLNAQEALGYQLVNRVSETAESVVADTLAIAERIASFSPDGVIVTRHGLRQAWETGSVEKAFAETASKYNEALFAGDNYRIGVEAFAQKKKPEWVDSKL